MNIDPGKLTSPEGFTPGRLILVMNRIVGGSSG